MTKKLYGELTWENRSVTLPSRFDVSTHVNWIKTLVYTHSKPKPSQRLWCGKHTAARKQDTFLNASQEKFSFLSLSLFRVRSEKWKQQTNLLKKTIIKLCTAIAQSDFAFTLSENFFGNFVDLESGWSQPQQTSVFAFEPLWNVFLGRGCVLCEKFLLRLPPRRTERRIKV